MTSIGIAGTSNDGYLSSMGKGVLGGTVAAGMFGAFSSTRIGALPAALWALPGSAGAGALTEFLERQGMGTGSAGFTAGTGIAAAAMGVALIAGKSHHPVIAGAAALTALGAVGGGILGSIWS